MYYTFKDWLKTPIETVNGLIFDQKPPDISFDQEDSPPDAITHLDFVNSVYTDIMKVINKHGYTISYKKSFKIKLAKILYSLSSSYGL